MRMKNAQRKIATDKGRKQPRRKRAVNLSVDAGLLAAARAEGINLSEALEATLAERVRTQRAEAWLRENREAIAEYNERIERDGVFGDKLRRF
jgi:antitoxin CcdA